MTWYESGSVSILCQDPRVFFAMEQSGTLVRLKVKSVKRNSTMEKI